MNNILILVLIPLLSVVGPNEAEIKIDDTLLDSKLNVIDNNTINSNGVYMDANDFTISSEEITEDNIDTLSGITVWDEYTGELYDYESMEYDKNSVTYKYDDMTLIVDYKTVNKNLNSFSNYSDVIFNSFGDSIISILLISIVVYIVVIFLVGVIRRTYLRIVKRISNLLE